MSIHPNSKPCVSLTHCMAGTSKARACIASTLLLAVNMFCVNAQAASIDYDLSRSLMLRNCDDQYWRGKVEAANACYTQILGSVTDYQVRAEAAWALGDLRAANMLFREAARYKGDEPQVRVRWGRLYLETHQDAEALKLFREALSANEKNIQAKLAVAQVMAGRFEGQARALAQEVLAQDDSTIEAHLLLARMSLEEGLLDEAEPAIEKALALSERAKLPPLDGYALQAALEALRGGANADARAQRSIDKALAYNPSYGGGYEVLGHFEMIRRRYKEAIAWLRRALAVEPTLASARAELGANLLRVGLVEEGQRELAKSYETDPYSVVTVNTLRLLDRFGEYEFGTQDDITLRLHKKEAEVLRPYALELTRASINAFSKRYGFELKEPVTVEFYPNHDDFAVRAAGLPGIGLLGVTFGYLVAMDSPSGRATGEFHWGSTLWHEMAHVFTLEATDHRVPRWLSEGISVFEEWRTGPTPGVVVPPDVLQAFKEGKFLPVEDLDAGFIRPRYPNQIQVSYMQAGLTCLFIEQRFGFEKLVALLKQYQRETNVAAAVKDTFKMTPKEFDAQFAEFVKTRYANLLPRLDDWEELRAKAAKALQASQWQDAIEPAREAIELYPEHVSDDSAYLMLSRAYAQLKQADAQVDTLQAYRKAGGWHPAALRELGTRLQEQGRLEDAIDVWLAINYSDPLQVESHLLAGEQLLANQRAAEAEREYRVLMALDTHDKALAHFGMARALRLQGKRTESRRHLLDALAIAPHYKPAQQLLLQTIEERATHE
jgi:tetratricopeptide (TPR) repeat protein